jgi:hypothetical protein
MKRIVRGRARAVNGKEILCLCIASEIVGKVFGKKIFWRK